MIFLFTKDIFPHMFRHLTGSNLLPAFEIRLYLLLFKLIYCLYSVRVWLAWLLNLTIFPGGT